MLYWWKYRRCRAMRDPCAHEQQGSLLNQPQRCSSAGQWPQPSFRLPQSRGVHLRGLPFHFSILQGLARDKVRPAVTGLFCDLGAGGAKTAASGIQIEPAARVMDINEFKTIAGASFPWAAPYARASNPTQSIAESTSGTPTTSAISSSKRS